MDLVLCTVVEFWVPLGGGPQRARWENFVQKIGIMADVVDFAKSHLDVTFWVYSSGGRYRFQN